VLIINVSVLVFVPFVELEP